MKTINSDLLRLYGNPGSIQYRILTGVAKDVAGGRVITQPCNVASCLVESFAEVSANVVQDVVSELNLQYPIQAQTADDLFRHMSDYDYVGWYSQPAGTMVELIFLLSTLRNAAEDVGGMYKKVVIPAYSEFRIKDRIFSTYYPVEIRMDANQASDSSALSVLYDISAKNPLFTLSDSLLEHHLFVEDRIPRVSIKLPVYQFKRSMTKYEIFTDAPFSKTLTYANRFYAVRVYTNKVYGTAPVAFKDKYNTAWTELHQTIESDVYDTAYDVIPAVTVQPDISAKTVRINVPQIFLSEGRLGDSLHIELFETHGAMEMITDVAQPVTAEFPMSGSAELDKYHKAFFKTENVIIFPMETQIVGGSNGLSFETLRNRVVYNSVDTRTIASRDDLTNSLKEFGFTVTGFKDGITSRILLCNRELVLDGTNVPSGLLTTDLNQVDLASTYGAYVHPDGSVTLSPKALFQYNPTKGVCLPVLNDHVLVRNLVDPSLPALTAAERSSLLNADIYTYTPFHLQLNNRYGTMLASTYDFTKPTMDKFVVTSASATVEHVNVYGGSVVLDEVNDLIRLRFRIDTTVALSVGDTYMLTVRLNNQDNTGVILTKDATLIDIDPVTRVPYLEFVLGTSYHVDIHNNLSITHDGANYSLPLAGDAACTLEWYKGNTRVFANYDFKLKLGEALTTVFSTVKTSITERELVAYQDDVPARYETNVYAKDPDGTIKCTVVDGEPVFERLHSIGDIIYNVRDNVYISEDNVSQYYGASHPDFIRPLSADTASWQEWGLPGFYDTVMEPVYLHRKGDPVLDHLGQPEYLQNNIRFQVNMLQVAVKSLHQPRPKYLKDRSALAAIREMIRGYCTHIETLDGQLLQNTEVYYQPTRSIGTALCRTNTQYTEHLNLEISVALRLHVARRVIASESTRLAIHADIVTLIDKMLLNGTCSLANLSKQILSNLYGTVDSVDVLGINGDYELQTIVPVDRGVNLSLAHVVVPGNDPQLTTVRALELEFVSSDVTPDIDSPA
jgi:hypothetical protein